MALKISKTFAIVVGLVLVSGLADAVCAIEPSETVRPVLGVAGVLHEFENRDSGVRITAVQPGSPATLLFKDKNDPGGTKFRLQPDEDVIVGISLADSQANAIKNFFELREFLSEISGGIYQIQIASKSKGFERETYFVILRKNQ